MTRYVVMLSGDVVRIEEVAMETWLMVFITFSAGYVTCWLIDHT